MTELDKNLTELPNGWVWTHLEVCVDILDGQRIPVNSDERQKRLGAIPYYGATGQVGWIDSYLFDEELILLGEDGAPFLDPYKNKAYIIKDKSWVNNHAHVLRAIRQLTSNSFLLYYLNSLDYHSFISGTTRWKLNQAPMRKIPIPLPPLPEQHRIVSKVEELFTKLDDGVAELKKVKLQLKRYQQSVLKSAFDGTLTSKWREEHKAELEPASMLLDKIKTERKKSGKYNQLSSPNTTDLPKLPEGWGWARIGEIVEALQYGTSEKTIDDSAGIPVVRMGNIQEGKLIFDKLKYLPPTSPLIGELLLQDGDILFNRTNSSELVGKVAKYNNSQPRAIFASYLIRIKPNRDAYDPDFMTYFINSFYGRQYINSVVTQQVGQANVNGTKLAMMPVPFCALAEQRKIVEGIERCFSVADEIEETVEQSLKQAERLRQSILKRAFEGKLVPQDPSDEPADKLLERIKVENTKIKMNSKRGRAVNVR